jgi:hypothetical protein
MADAENRAGWPPLRRASRFRNGLIVALLARRALRLKNFAAIAIGRHLVGREERYALLFPAGEMKNKQPYEVMIPDGLVGPLERYLTFWRGILLTRGLIEEIRVTPEDNGNAVELAGELAALLRLGGNKNAASLEEAARSGLLVAGTRIGRNRHSLTVPI